MGKVRTAVLISGRGSNMVSLALAAKGNDYPADISLVVSNRADAGGLAAARELGISTHVIEHKDYATREAHELAIHEYLSQERIELVCLAGYMRVLTETLVTPWNGRMINIHPSLLPSFSGLSTHESALQAGVRIHGCTVHFVSGELDGGPIIAQGAVPVLSNDTANSLAARVLQVEHKIYPNVLNWVASGKVRWADEQLHYAPELAPTDLALFDI